VSSVAGVFGYPAVVVHVPAGGIVGVVLPPRQIIVATPLLAVNALHVCPVVQSPSDAHCATHEPALHTVIESQPSVPVAAGLQASPR
jgi:hypothetical protein